MAAAAGTSATTRSASSRVWRWHGSCRSCTWSCRPCRVARRSSSTRAASPRWRSVSTHPDRSACPYSQPHHAGGQCPLAPRPVSVSVLSASPRWRSVSTRTPAGQRVCTLSLTTLAVSVHSHPGRSACPYALSHHAGGQCPLTPRPVSVSVRSVSPRWRSVSTRTPAGQRVCTLCLTTLAVSVHSHPGRSACLYALSHHAGGQCPLAPRLVSVSVRSVSPRWRSVSTRTPAGQRVCTLCLTTLAVSVHSHPGRSACLYSLSHHAGGQCPLTPRLVSVSVRSVSPRWRSVSTHTPAGQRVRTLCLTTLVVSVHSHPGRSACLYSLSHHAGGQCPLAPRPVSVSVRSASPRWRSVSTRTPAGQHVCTLCLTTLAVSVHSHPGRSACLYALSHHAGGQCPLAPRPVSVSVLSASPRWRSVSTRTPAGQHVCTLCLTTLAVSVHSHPGRSACLYALSHHAGGQCPLTPRPVSVSVLSVSPRWRSVSTRTPAGQRVRTLSLTTLAVSVHSHPGRSACLYSQPHHAGGQCPLAPRPVSVSVLSASPRWRSVSTRTPAGQRVCTLCLTTLAVSVHSHPGWSACPYSQPHHAGGQCSLAPRPVSVSVRSVSPRWRSVSTRTPAGQRVRTLSLTTLAVSVHSHPGRSACLYSLSHHAGGQCPLAPRPVSVSVLSASPRWWSVSTRTPAGQRVCTLSLTTLAVSVHSHPSRSACPYSQPHHAGGQCPLAPRPVSVSVRSVSPRWRSVSTRTPAGQRVRTLCLTMLAVSVHSHPGRSACLYSQPHHAGGQCPLAPRPVSVSVRSASPRWRSVSTRTPAGQRVCTLCLTTLAVSVHSHPGRSACLYALSHHAGGQCPLAPRPVSVSVLSVSPCWRSVSTRTPAGQRVCTLCLTTLAVSVHSHPGRSACLYALSHHAGGQCPLAPRPVSVSVLSASPRWWSVSTRTPAGQRVCTLSLTTLAVSVHSHPGRSACLYALSHHAGGQCPLAPRPVSVSVLSASPCWRSVSTRTPAGQRVCTLSLTTLAVSVHSHPGRSACLYSLSHHAGGQCPLAPRPVSVSVRSVSPRWRSVSTRTPAGQRVCTLSLTTLAVSVHSHPGRSACPYTLSHHAGGQCPLAPRPVSVSVRSASPRWRSVSTRTPAGQRVCTLSLTTLAVSVHSHPGRSACLYSQPHHAGGQCPLAPRPVSVSVLSASPRWRSVSTRTPAGQRVCTLCLTTLAVSVHSHPGWSACPYSQPHHAGGQCPLAPRPVSVSVRSVSPRWRSVSTRTPAGQRVRTLSLTTLAVSVHSHPGRSACLYSLSHHAGGQCPLAPRPVSVSVLSASPRWWSLSTRTPAGQRVCTLSLTTLAVSVHSHPSRSACPYSQPHHAGGQCPLAPRPVSVSVRSVSPRWRSVSTRTPAGQRVRTLCLTMLAVSVHSHPGRSACLYSQPHHAGGQCPLAPRPVSVSVLSVSPRWRSVSTRTPAGQRVCTLCLTTLAVSVHSHPGRSACPYSLSHHAGGQCPLAPRPVSVSVRSVSPRWRSVSTRTPAGQRVCTLCLTTLAVSVHSHPGRSACPYSQPHHAGGQCPLAPRPVSVSVLSASPRWRSVSTRTPAGQRVCTLCLTTLAVSVHSHPGRSACLYALSHHAGGQCPLAPRPVSVSVLSASPRWRSVSTRTPAGQRVRMLCLTTLAVSVHSHPGRSACLYALSHHAGGQCPLAPRPVSVSVRSVSPRWRSVSTHTPAGQRVCTLSLTTLAVSVHSHPGRSACLYALSHHAGGQCPLAPRPVSVSVLSASPRWRSVSTHTPAGQRVCTLCLTTLAVSVHSHPGRSACPYALSHHAGGQCPLAPRPVSVSVRSVSPRWRSVSTRTPAGQRVCTLSLTTLAVSVHSHPGRSACLYSLSNHAGGQCPLAPRPVSVSVRSVSPRWRSVSTRTPAGQRVCTLCLTTLAVSVHSHPGRSACLYSQPHHAGGQCPLAPRPVSVSVRSVSPRWRSVSTRTPAGQRVRTLCLTTLAVSVHSHPGRSACPYSQPHHAGGQCPLAPRPVSVSVLSVSPRWRSVSTHTPAGQRVRTLCLTTLAVSVHSHPGRSACLYSQPHHAGGQCPLTPRPVSVSVLSASPRWRSVSTRTPAGQRVCTLSLTTLAVSVHSHPGRSACLYALSHHAGGQCPLAPRPVSVSVLSASPRWRSVSTHTPAGQRVCTLCLTTLAVSVHSHPGRSACPYALSHHAGGQCPLAPRPVSVSVRSVSPRWRSVSTRTPAGQRVCTLCLTTLAVSVHSHPGRSACLYALSHHAGGQCPLAPRPVSVSVRSVSPRWRSVSTRTPAGQRVRTLSLTTLAVSVHSHPGRSACPYALSHHAGGQCPLAPRPVSVSVLSVSPRWRSVSTHTPAGQRVCTLSLTTLAVSVHSHPGRSACPYALSHHAGGQCPLAPRPVSVPVLSASPRWRSVSTRTPAGQRVRTLSLTTLAVSVHSHPGRSACLYALSHHAGGQCPLTPRPVSVSVLSASPRWRSVSTRTPAGQRVRALCLTTLAVSVHSHPGRSACLYSQPHHAGGQCPLAPRPVSVSVRSVSPRWRSVSTRTPAGQRVCTLCLTTLAVSVHSHPGRSACLYSLSHHAGGQCPLTPRPVSVSVRSVSPRWRSVSTRTPAGQRVCTLSLTTLAVSVHSHPGRSACLYALSHHAGGQCPLAPRPVSVSVRSVSPRWRSVSTRTPAGQRVCTLCLTMLAVSVHSHPGRSACLYSQPHHAGGQCPLAPRPVSVSVLSASPRWRSVSTRTPAGQRVCTLCLTTLAVSVHSHPGRSACLYALPHHAGGQCPLVPRPVSVSVLSASPRWRSVSTRTPAGQRVCTLCLTTLAVSVHSHPGRSACLYALSHHAGGQCPLAPRPVSVSVRSVSPRWRSVSTRTPAGQRVRTLSLTTLAVSVHSHPGRSACLYSLSHHTGGQCPLAPRPVSVSVLSVSPRWRSVSTRTPAGQRVRTLSHHAGGQCPLAPRPVSVSVRSVSPRWRSVSTRTPAGQRVCTLCLTTLAVSVHSHPGRSACLYSLSHHAGGQCPLTPRPVSVSVLSVSPRWRSVSTRTPAGQRVRTLSHHAGGQCPLAPRPVSVSVRSVSPRWRSVSTRTPAGQRVRTLCLTTLAVSVHSHPGRSACPYSQPHHAGGQCPLAPRPVSVSVRSVSPRWRSVSTRTPAGQRVRTLCLTTLAVSVHSHPGRSACLYSLSHHAGGQCPLAPRPVSVSVRSVSPRWRSVSTLTPAGQRVRTLSLTTLAVSVHSHPGRSACLYSQPHHAGGQCPLAPRPVSVSVRSVSPRWRSVSTRTPAGQRVCTLCLTTLAVSVHSHPGRSACLYSQPHHAGGQCPLAPRPVSVSVLSASPRWRSVSTRTPAGQRVCTLCLTTLAVSVHSHPSRSACPYSQPHHAGGQCPLAPRPVSVSVRSVSPRWRSVSTRTPAGQRVCTLCLTTLAVSVHSHPGRSACPYSQPHHAGGQCPLAPRPVSVSVRSVSPRWRSVSTRTPAGQRVCTLCLTTLAVSVHSHPGRSACPYSLSHHAGGQCPLAPRPVSVSVRSVSPRWRSVSTRTPAGQRVCTLSLTTLAVSVHSHPGRSACLYSQPHHAGGQCPLTPRPVSVSVLSVSPRWRSVSTHTPAGQRVRTLCLTTLAVSVHSHPGRSACLYSQPHHAGGQCPLAPRPVSVSVLSASPRWRSVSTRTPAGQRVCTLSLTTLAVSVHSHPGRSACLYALSHHVGGQCPLAPRPVSVSVLSVSPRWRSVSTRTPAGQRVRTLCLTTLAVSVHSHPGRSACLYSQPHHAGGQCPLAPRPVSVSVLSASPRWRSVSTRTPAGQRVCTLCLTTLAVSVHSHPGRSACLYSLSHHAGGQCPLTPRPVSVSVLSASPRWRSVSTHTPAGQRVRTLCLTTLAVSVHSHPGRSACLYSQPHHAGGQCPLAPRPVSVSVRSVSPRWRSVSTRTPAGQRVCTLCLTTLAVSVHSHPGRSACLYSLSNHAGGQCPLAPRPVSVSVRSVSPRWRSVSTHTPAGQRVCTLSLTTLTVSVHSHPGRSACLYSQPHHAGGQCPLAPRPVSMSVRSVSPRWRSVSTRTPAGQRVRTLSLTTLAVSVHSHPGRSACLYALSHHAGGQCPLAPRLVSVSVRSVSPRWRSVSTRTPAGQRVCTLCLTTLAVSVHSHPGRSACLYSLSHHAGGQCPLAPRPVSVSVRSVSPRWRSVSTRTPAGQRVCTLCLTTLAVSVHSHPGWSACLYALSHHAGGQCPLAPRPVSVSVLSVSPRWRSVSTRTPAGQRVCTLCLTTLAVSVHSHPGRSACLYSQSHHAGGQCPLAPRPVSVSVHSVSPRWWSVSTHTPAGQRVCTLCLTTLAVSVHSHPGRSACLYALSHHAGGQCPLTPRPVSVSVLSASPRWRSVSTRTPAGQRVRTLCLTTLAVSVHSHPGRSACLYALSHHAGGQCPLAPRPVSVSVLSASPRWRSVSTRTPAGQRVRTLCLTTLAVSVHSHPGRSACLYSLSHHAGGQCPLAPRPVSVSVRSVSPRWRSVSTRTPAGQRVCTLSLTTLAVSVHSHPGRSACLYSQPHHAGGQCPLAPRPVSMSVLSASPRWRSVSTRTPAGQRVCTLCLTTLAVSVHSHPSRSACLYSQPHHAGGQCPLAPRPVSVSVLSASPRWRSVSTRTPAGQRVCTLCLTTLAVSVHSHPSRSACPYSQPHHAGGQCPLAPRPVSVSVLSVSPRWRSVSTRTPAGQRVRTLSLTTLAVSVHSHPGRSACLYSLSHHAGGQCPLAPRPVSVSVLSASPRWRSVSTRTPAGQRVCTLCLTTLAVSVHSHPGRSACPYALSHHAGGQCPLAPRPVSVSVLSASPRWRSVSTRTPAGQRVCTLCLTTLAVSVHSHPGRSACLYSQPHHAGGQCPLAPRPVSVSVRSVSPCWRSVSTRTPAGQRVCTLCLTTLAVSVHSHPGRSACLYSQPHHAGGQCPLAPRPVSVSVRSVSPRWRSVSTRTPAGQRVCTLSLTTLAVSVHSHPGRSACLYAQSHHAGGQCPLAPRPVSVSVRSVSPR